VKRFRILAFGEVLWDLLPAGPQFGGAPANFAGQAASLGLEVAILSAVGNDPLGQQAVQRLLDAGVQTSLIQTTAQFSTGTVGVSLDRVGKPMFEIHTGSAWDVIEWSDSAAEYLRTADVLCFGTLSQRGDVSQATLRRLLKDAEGLPLLRVLDVNLRRPFYSHSLILRSIQAANVLKLSDEELPIVAEAVGLSSGRSTESLLADLREQFSLRLVAMTQGADGATLLTSDAVVRQAGFSVTVVDTIGAGDAFTAAMLCGLLRGEEPAKIAMEACRHAPFSCPHAGALPGAASKGSCSSEQ